MPFNSNQINEFVTSSYDKKGTPQIDNYILDKQLSTRKAKVYHDPTTNKTVVANRGTTGTISDWKNNLAYITGNYDTTDRLKQAENVQNKAIQKYGKVDANVTHSQSAIIGRKLNEEGKTGQVIEVNPAIMFEKQKKNEYIIKSKYDPVSVLTNLNPFLKNENNTIIEGNTFNPLIEHSANILKRIGGVFGQGLMIGGKNEITNYQIDNELKGYKNYKGCFIKNALPKILTKGFYVINLNGHSHWTVLYKDNDYFYFDSFGFEPPKEVETKIGDYYWNDKDIQDIDTSSCGYYCIAFIKFMNNKINPLKEFNNFVSLFSKDYKKNEQILKVLLEHL